MQPEIRFNGFNDEWVEKKLGDVVGKIQSGNRLPKSSLIDGDVPYVVAQTKNDGVLKKIARGTLDYNGNLMKLFPGNSISFSIDNPDAMFYRNAEFYTSNIMRVIHEEHLTHEQYVFILENMRRFTKGYDWTHKFSGPVVSNLKYPQPSKEEQQKIGALFSKYDAIIALREQKLAELNALKKGMLQQMFDDGVATSHKPQATSHKPQVRFSGFNDVWLEKKLGEVSTVLRGSSPRPIHDAKWFDKTSDVGWLKISDVTAQNGQIKNLSLRLSELGQEKTRVLVEPHLLLSIAATVGSPVMTHVKTGVHDGFVIFEDICFEKEFMFYRLELFKPSWKRYGQPGSQLNLNIELVKNQKFDFPMLPEQQKIGQLFKHLDVRISNEQSKIEQLKAQKQGLLEGML